MNPSSSEPLPKERENLILHRYADLSQQGFRTSEQPRVALAAVGITNLALLDTLKCGYSTGKLSELLPADESLTADVIKSGLLTPKRRERLANCIIFPVVGSDGRISSFIGLAADGEMKTLSNRRTIPWNLPAAKSASSLSDLGQNLA